VSGAIAMLIFSLCGVGFLAARIAKHAMRRRRPGLPPPQRAAARDCFNS
jgi:hypothetical protein